MTVKGKARRTPVGSLDPSVVLGAWESYVQGEAVGQSQALDKETFMHTEAGRNVHSII